MKITLLFVILIGFSTFAFGQTEPPGILNMYIIPAEPTENDEIDVVIAAWHNQSNCYLNSATVGIVGNTIHVYTDYFTGWGALFCSTLDTIPLGQFDVGHYYIIGHYDHNTFQDTDTLKFTIGTPTDVGVAEIIENEIRLYPNPANEMITVSMDLTSPAEAHLEIFDAQGKLVANPNLGYKAYGEHTFSINVSHLSSGLYLVKISAGDNNAITKRFIKQ